MDSFPSTSRVASTATFITRLLIASVSLATATYGFRIERDVVQVNAFSSELLNSRGLNQFGSLQSRDVCSDAFPGRHKQTCSPSQSLCCIDPNASLPVCQTIAGYGACCTEDATCFVDLESACSDSNSTQCAKGLCCPAQTKCIANFNYTTDALVRCNINQALVPASISSLVSSSTTRRTATRSASATTSTGTGDTTTASIPAASNTAASQPSAAPSSTDTGGPGGNGSGNGLSSGAIAGIAIGSVAAAGIWGILSYLLWKRRQSKKKQEANTQPNPYNPYPPPPQEMSGGNQIHEAPMGYDANGKPLERYGHVEMPVPDRPHELL